MALEDALEAAVEGERGALESFFRELLEAKLVVPRRFQALPLSDSPEYPNQLIDVLGIRDRERVVVPAFTSSDLMKEWAGTEFQTRDLSIADITAILPPDWWVCINPGSEAQKELSPWELEQLKAGSDSIAVLVDESLAYEAERGMSFEPLSAEFEPLSRILRQFADSRSEVLAIYLLQQSTTAPALPAVVVGVRTTSISQAAQEQLRSEVLSISEKALIGAASVQVMLGGAIGGSMLDEVFSGFSPIFERRSGIGEFLTKVKGLFSRS